MKFSGFSKETLKFFRELEKNNSKSFFDENRPAYENYVMAQSRDFVTDMGNRLNKISHNLNAEPRVNKSIFRINRDVRFSKDKTPYKTHLALWFWDGDGARMESSGYYFHLEPGMLMLGAGIHTFQRVQLDEFRRSVVDGVLGKELRSAAEKIFKNENFSIGGSHYKKIPRGYESGDRNADFLLHNGLYASFKCKIPDELFDERLLEFCYNKFNVMSPLHRWLYKMTLRAGC